MNQTTFLRQRNDGVEEYRIGTRKWVPAPTFIPEVKGAEDVLVLLNHRNALDDNNPILVPGYRWSDLRSRPMFSEYEESLKEMIRGQPTIYWDPPELFRYTRADTLVTYAFRGSRSKRRRFNSHIRNGRIDEALDIVPAFFRAFVERGLESLIKNTSDAEVPPDLAERYPQSEGKIVDAWRDPRVDQGFQEYFVELAEDAARFPQTYVVPTVPPLLRSSSKEDLKRVRGANRAMAAICEAVRESQEGHPVVPYFHLYVDYAVLQNGTDADQRILNMAERELQDTDYAGVILTLTGYERTWENNLVAALEAFTTNLTNLARENHLPVFATRSGWYGEFLTDAGVHAFSSLFNGADVYTQKGGGGMDFKHQYGKVAVPDTLEELSVEDLERALQEQGELPQVDGLPSTPPGYTPSGPDLKQRLGTPRDFRIHFGKPRRLMHCEEARRLREARREGVPNPARRYVERSSHHQLGG